MRLLLYRCIGFIFLLSMPATSLVAGETYCFRVYLKDKVPSEYFVAQPEAYLSADAIQRRVERGIPITAEDMPVSEAYLSALADAGTTPVVTSRWMNTVVVSAADSLVVSRLAALAMVDSVKWIWRGDTLSACEEERDSTRLYPVSDPLKVHYGYADNQITMLKGEKLHLKGFRGEGMKVAVIDAGFTNVDRMQVFDGLQLLGTHNVASPRATVFDGDDHGTKVLSCLAASVPGQLVGTAPKASYLLIKSEDSRSEFPIEEDYWVAAAEYADSMGVDVITSSLGYFAYDADELSHCQDELDGKTAFISRGAAIVPTKGILLFCSAGNEGCSEWEKISFPSDVSAALTVGSITMRKEKSYFSSVGYTADNRVKPDVVALGSGCGVIDKSGSVEYADGTSFSTPIVAGLGTCLWQAFPKLTNLEIIDILQRAAHQYKRPDAEQGYGIPDMNKAYKYGRKYVSSR